MNPFNPDDLSNSLNDALSTLGIDTTHSQSVHDHSNQFNTLDHSQNNGLHSFSTNSLDTSHLHLHQPESWHTNHVTFHSAPNSVSTNTSMDDWNAHHHFDPNHPHGTVIGNPAHEMSHWHQQTRPDTCAVAVQQSVIEATTGHHFSEHQLANFAGQQGWYNQGTGTPITHFGELVTAETHIPVGQHFHGSLQEIATQLAHGEHVMVAVNSQILNMPDSHSIFSPIADDMLKGAVDSNHFANHAVEVIGIKYPDNDWQHPVVILNDPSSPDGKGVEIPADQFTAAWKTGGNFIASTAEHSDNNLSASHQDYANLKLGGGWSASGNSGNETIYNGNNIILNCNGRTFNHVGTGYVAGYMTACGDIFDGNNNKIGHASDGCAWDCCGNRVSWGWSSDRLAAAVFVAKRCG
jgi:hypothetical protein